MNSVEMKSIVKKYPLVTAVDNVDFCVESGEIHCLLGENGAGKTTLMKILYGMTMPDGGTIKINGKEAAFRDPKDAIRCGLSMVHQHFQLVPVLTVAENIVVGEEHQPFLYFNKKKAIKEVEEIIKRYGFHIDASKKVGELSVGEQQRVEIVKALYRETKILILDEPTAVLTPQEVEELFVVMRQMRSMGITIIIITHKLKEAIEISDHVSVMRDGKMIESGIPTSQCTVESLANMMVGRQISLSSTRRTKVKGEAVVELSGLTVEKEGKKVVNDFSFTIHAGEIHGIAGVEGNGQTELIEALTGLIEPQSMKLTVKGKPMSGGAVEFLHGGVGHVPENRNTRGLVAQMTVAENMILGYHRTDRFSHKGILNLKEIHQFAKQGIEDYAIKVPGENELVSSLSGGNQQKVVISRVFSENPDFIVVAQPTRGVDVGAMEYIHDVLLHLRDRGAAILLLSADLDEVIRLSDTLSVIYEGSLVSTTPADTLTELQIGQLMLTGSLNGGEGR